MRKKLLKHIVFVSVTFVFINGVTGQESDRIELNGEVVSSVDNLKLIGVNISEKGTNNGVISDVDGKFKINVGSQAQLLVSYIGFITQTVQVNNRSHIKIVLTPTSVELGDVVVIGYGTQRKKNVTGSVSSISSEDLTINPLPSVDQALQGKLPGVTITNNSGDPGGGVSVRIRGEGTIGSSNPLYVIDGVPIVENPHSEIPLNGTTGKLSNPLANLNPSDIESIDVLKDASSAAIYGVRGANGVIIITTKKGKKGTPAFSFSSYVAVKKVDPIDLLGARDYANLIIEMFDNAGEKINADNEPTNLLNDEYVVDRTDWQDEFFKTGIAQNYNLSLSGGNDIMNYNISGGYHKDNATTVGSNFKRYSLRLNSNYTLGRFRFGESVFLSRTVNRRAPYLDARSQIRTLNQHAPTVAVYNPNNDGGFGGPSNGDGYNRWNTIGLAKLTRHYVKRNRVIGNIYAEYEILENLKYKLNLGLDFVYTKGHAFVSSYYFSPGQKEDYATLREYSTDEISPLVENTLHYQKQLGDHKLGVLAGYSQQKYTFSRFSSFSNALHSNNLETLNTSRADAEISVSGFDDEWAIRSFFGRISYDYKNKYLFLGNIRRDGSSRFAKDNRYGVFPSFSVGWRVSEEDFFKDKTFIDDLKIKAGYGKLGNQDVPSYGFQSSLITTANYVFGGNVQSGITQITLANPDLKWEKTIQKNVGLEMDMLENRLHFSVEYFIKTTKDIILRAPLPGSLGISDLPLVNAGTIENKGLEILAGYNGSIGGVGLSVSGNVSFLSNEVKSLGIGLPIEGRFPDNEGQVLSVMREGEALNSFFGHVTDGIFQNQAEIDAHADQPRAEPGDIRFKDLDNNGVINDKDRTILGDPNPDITYGFSANVNYKGFDFSFFFQGISKVEIYNGLRFWNEGMAQVYNHTTDVLNRWTGEGTSNTIPRAVLHDPNFNRRPSDRFLENGGYLRLKNIAIGYSMPQNILSKIGNGVIKNLRIYVSGQNLLTFTDYSGYDPEIGSGFNLGVDVANQGVDYGIIPQPKTFLTGIEIKF